MRDIVDAFAEARNLASTVYLQTLNLGMKNSAAAVLNKLEIAFTRIDELREVVNDAAQR